MSLGSFLPIDTLVVADRVFSQVVEQLGQRARAEGLGRLPPEDLIARAIVNWMSPYVAPGSTTALGSESLSLGGGADLGDSFDGVAEVDEIGRSAELAAALGACECWGEANSCAICGGRGVPGWVEPDRELFSYYVQPAIRRLRTDARYTSRSAAARHRPTNGAGAAHTLNGATRKKDQDD